MVVIALTTIHNSSGYGYVWSSRERRPWIDPILDKITKFGIGSLTPSERRQLNPKREQLLKKSE
jgi:hypothetical protein